MKLAIITGTSQGLGKALFDQLIVKNIFVISISRRFSDKQLELQKEKKCLLIRLDLKRVTNKILENKFLSVSKNIKKTQIYYFNNAFVLSPTGLIGNLDENELRTAIQINIISSVLLVNFILQTFKAHHLHLVNISSGAAKRAIIGWPIYCSTKSANEMFFDVLKQQSSNNPKIKVFNIRPGVINTNMQKQIRSLPKNKFPFVNTFKEYHKTGKLASSSDVAKRILKEIKI